MSLAPLATRRDIAMLGLIQRTILGKGPSRFSAFVHCDAQNSRKLIDPRRTCKCPLISRSALGLVTIYNMLPNSVTCEKSVSVFQKGLQDIKVSLATAGHPHCHNGCRCSLHACLLHSIHSKVVSSLPQISSEVRLLSRRHKIPGTGARGPQGYE